MDNEWRVDYIDESKWEFAGYYTDLAALHSAMPGHLCTAIDKRTNKNVLIKKLARPFHSINDAKRVYREIYLLKYLKNEYIVELLDVFTTSKNAESLNDIYMVTNCFPTTLAHIIQQGLQKSPLIIEIITYQLLCGLKYLHSSNIIHRDLKPSNISIDEFLSIKITGFDFTTIKSNENLTGYVGTRWYKAPEVTLNYIHYSEAVDIWSTGCILAEMILEKVLFRGKNQAEQLKLIFETLGLPPNEILGETYNIHTLKALYGPHLNLRNKHNRPDFSDDAISKAIRLMERMLEVNPNNRITAKEALEYDFTAAYRDVNYEPEGTPLSTKYEDKCFSINEWKKIIFNLINATEIDITEKTENKLEERINDCANELKTLSTKPNQTNIMVHEVLVQIEENRILVELIRDDSIFKLGIVEILHNPKVSNSSLQKWEPDYKIKELDIDFPRIRRGFVTVIQSNSNYLFIIDNKSQDLHVYYKNKNADQITYEKVLSIKNIKDTKQKYKTSFIDENDETKAYVVLFNQSTQEINIRMFKIEKNICTSESFTVNLANTTLDKYFNCVFTAKSNYLVAWNFNKNSLCYFDFKSNKKIFKNFDGLVINDLRVLPNTDNVVLLSSNSIDCVEAQTDLNELTYFKRMIICNNELKSIRIKRNFLFLFINETSCQIYDLGQLNVRQANCQPDFEVRLEGIEDDVYVTSDSKHLFLKTVKVLNKKQNCNVHFFEIKSKNEVKEIEIDRSLLKLKSENFTDFFELENSIIMIKDHQPYVINFN